MGSSELALASTWVLAFTWDLGFASFWGLDLEPGPEGVTWVTLGLKGVFLVTQGPGLKLTNPTLGRWLSPASPSRKLTGHVFFLKMSSGSRRLDAQMVPCVAWRLLSKLSALRKRGNRDNKPQSRKEPGRETTRCLAASLALKLVKKIA